MMYVAMGAMLHESNTFSPIYTDLDAFKRTQYLAGDDIVRYHKGTRSEMGGILEGFAARGVKVFPTLSAWAMPSGVVKKETYAQIKNGLLQGVKSELAKLHGILLTLHGSMAVEGLEDPEGDLLEGMRALFGPGKYVAATLDHHANVSSRMVENSDFLIGYRTHPHVDQFEVGLKAAELMAILIEKRPKLSKSFVKLPLITPAENRSEPIVKLASEIKRIEADARIFSSSYFVGYPWADVSIQGASTLAITYDDQPLAEKNANTLAALMWSLRKDFQFRLYSIEEALEEGSRSVKKPVLLDELPDCTLGGSSGDVVASLRCMINAGVKDSVAVGIVDPEAVSAAVKAGVGAAVRLMIGGKVCTQDNPPLEFAGKVKKIGKNVGGDSTIHAGYETKVGNVAVLEGSGIEVVLIEYPGKIGGPTFLEKVGIDPRAKQFILTKEGLNCLVEYRDIAGQILMVNSPGFNRQILRARDYKNIRRPIYPIDPDMTWSP